MNFEIKNLWIGQIKLSNAKRISLVFKRWEKFLNFQFSASKIKHEVILD